MPTVHTHVLLPGADTGRVLVLDGALPVLPVDVAPDETLIVALRRALLSAWSLDAVVLETHLPPPPAGDRQDQVALAVLEPADPHWSPRSASAWAPPPAVREARIAARATSWIAEWQGTAEPPPLRPRWSRPGWHPRATAWVQARLEEAGRRIAGPIEVRRLWSISALMRIPTTAGDVWFKAVFPHFHHEPAVTARLAKLVPGLVPPAIAIDADEGWLLLDGTGGPMRDVADADAAVLAAIGRLSDLQLAVGDRLDSFHALGCPRRPLSELADALAAAVAEFEALGAPGVPPGRARRAVEWVRDRAAWLDELGMEEVLVHGDFHPGNLLADPDGTRIIDWSDAAITNPVMEIGPWFGEVRPELRPQGWEAWLTAFMRFGPAEALRDHHQDAYALACAYQVVSYAGILRGIEPANRYQLRDGLLGYWRDLDVRVPGQDAASLARAVRVGRA